MSSNNNEPAMDSNGLAAADNNVLLVNHEIETSSDSIHPDQDELREIGSTSSNASFPSDRHRSASSSEREDFVKFGQDELAEIPSELLADYGSRMVRDVIHEVTQSPASQPAEPPQLRTPSTDDLASPISTYTMDERDLYVPRNAAAAEAHPIGDTGVTNEDEGEEMKLDYSGSDFDSLAGRKSPSEELSRIPEGKNQENLMTFGDGDEPEYALQGKDEQVGIASRPTHPLNSSGTVGKNEEGNRFEVGHEPNVDELDLLEDDGFKAPQEQDILSTIPESPKDVRDFKADEEEATYDRKGPLTIPAGFSDTEEFVSSGNKSASDDTEYLEAAKAHSWPRPPTPPKVLDESAEKPEAVDLGPPHHHYHAFRRPSEKGLPQSILVKHREWTWKDFCGGLDPRAVSILQYVALMLSAGITVYTIGDYTRQFIRDKKQVLEIVYWRDPKRSAAALVVILFALYLIARCSVISLAAYTALAALAGTVGFRLFKLAEAQIKKSDGSNPFKHYLEQDVDVPKEKIHTQVDIFIEHAQSLFKHLRHLFLVESLIDSIKFGLLLYTLTYVGAWFSGITLVLIFVLAVFTVPKVYELYKEPIDNYIAIAREHVEKVQNTVQDKVPFVRRLETKGAKKEQ